MGRATDEQMDAARAAIAAMDSEQLTNVHTWANRRNAEIRAERCAGIEDGCEARLVGIRPKYLDGLRVEVLETAGGPAGKARVRLLEPVHGRAGARWRVGETFRCPMGCLRRV